MKKPINTNPFKRPFSQNIPKRKDMARGNQEYVREEVVIEEDEEEKPSISKNKQGQAESLVE
jgi:hypothetical protein